MRMRHKYQLCFLACALLLWQGVLAPESSDNESQPDYDDYWPDLELPLEQEAIRGFLDSLTDPLFSSSLDCHSVKFMMRKFIHETVLTSEECSRACSESRLALDTITGLLMAVPARIDYFECRRVNLVCQNVKAFFYDVGTSEPHIQQLPSFSPNRHRNYLRHYCAHLTYLINTFIYIRQGKGASEATWISSVSYCERILNDPLVSDSASERPGESQQSQARGSHERTEQTRGTCVCAMKIYFPAIFSKIQPSAEEGATLSPFMRNMIANHCNITVLLPRFQADGWLVNRVYFPPQDDFFECSEARFRRCPPIQEMSLGEVDL